MSRPSKNKDQKRNTPARSSLGTSFFGWLLIVAVILAYQQVWHFGFIWDDDQHLTQNPCIIGPLGLKEIWTTAAARICPLVLSNFWLQHQLWGLEPLPYHLMNVGFHAASAVVLWKVLKHLQMPGAWLGAALWALHPVQVETVAWVTELKNTQSGLFFLLTLWFFLKWQEGEASAARKSSERDYALALVCAALAMASKSSTVILPLVLGLGAWWQEGRWRWNLLIRLAPFFLLAMIASGLAMWTQHLEGANEPEWVRGGPERLATVGRVAWFYLGKLLAPYPLIFVYPRWEIDPAQISTFFPSLALVVVWLVLWRKRHSQWRPLFFGFTYFLIALLPVLGLVNHYFLRYSFVGDHFQYLASIGPLALVAAGITQTLIYLEKQKIFLRPVLYGVLLVGLGVWTWRQSAQYESDEALWRTTLLGNLDCWMAYTNLGIGLLQKGQADQAEFHFRKALTIKPVYAIGQNNLGSALLQEGKMDDAIVHFQKALEITPDFAEAHCNLGNALLHVDRVEEAVMHSQKALALRPSFAEANYNLGNAMMLKGQPDKAGAYFQKALALDPDQAEAHNNLGSLLLQEGKVDEAITHFSRAVQLQPANASFQANLAWILATTPRAELRNGGRAVSLAEQANQLTGETNPVILRTLAASYAEAGRFSEAAETALRGLEGAHAEANTELGKNIRNEIKLYQAHTPFHEIE
jgi:tetratricopeptide (TPR) repeat protein